MRECMGQSDCHVYEFPTLNGLCCKDTSVKELVKEVRKRAQELRTQGKYNRSSPPPSEIPTPDTQHNSKT